ncbi:unnamed protein product, partial [Didymodactylos carnosus]
SKTNPGVHIPKDFGPHTNNFGSEWTYLTGNFKSQTNSIIHSTINLCEEKHLKFSFFIAVFYDTIGKNHVVNFGLTVISQKFHYNQTDISPHGEISNVKKGQLWKSTFSGEIITFSVSQINPTQTLGSIGTQYLLQINDKSSNISISLLGMDQAGVLYHGIHGFFQGPSNCSGYEYFSLPHLLSAGTIIYQKQVYSVSGILWLDRQYGNAPSFNGWYWYGLQIDDVSMSVYTFHTENNTILQDLTAVNILSIHKPTTKTLKGSNVKIKIRSTWKSPQTSIFYPTSVEIHIPHFGTITTEPFIKNQEFVSNLHGWPLYYEGFVHIKLSNIGYKAKQTFRKKFLLQHQGNNEINGYGFQELTDFNKNNLI